MAQMTKEGYEKLKKTLEGLIKKRPIISKAIGEARDHGDLKENSAYHAAKEEQGLNEMRIKDLEAQLENATIVDKSATGRKDIVSLGSKFRIKALDTGDEMEFTLVSDSEADPFQRLISPDSPVGEAVVGMKKGDVVEVDIPRGLVKYEILEIK